MDKQKAWRPGCIYNIENTDLEIGVSCISYIYDNILAHIDVLALLAHFTGYALTFYNRMIQRSLLRRCGTSIHVGAL